MSKELTTKNNFSIQSVIEKAVSSGADLSVIERLYALQVENEKRIAEREFYKALSDFKAEGVKILKNAKSHKSKYATLDNIINTVTPILSKYLLNLTWRTETIENKVKVTAILSHFLGFSIETSMTSPPETSGSKNAIQALGSAKSYLERYTATAILGLAASDIDNDGNGFKPANYKKINEEQEADLLSLLEENGKSVDKFMKHCKINKLSDLSYDAYERWIKTFGGSI